MDGPQGGGGGGIGLQGGPRAVREGAHRGAEEERGEEERHRPKGANQTLFGIGINLPFGII